MEFIGFDWVGLVRWAWAGLLGCMGQLGWFGWVLFGIVGSLGLVRSVGLVGLDLVGFGEIFLGLARIGWVGSVEVSSVFLGWLGSVGFG